MRPTFAALAAPWIVAWLGAPAPADEVWRFVAPPPGDPFDGPPARALPLASVKPADVVEAATFRGAKRRYAQVRYGGSNSVRVAVVLDEIKPGEADLYVDANRDRTIGPEDRVEGKGRTWRVPLDLATTAADGSAVTERRAATFKLGSTGATLSLAAAGYLDGTVAIDGRAHAARRVDGDANGSVADPADRLWLDLDDDGRWDPAAEQFLFGPILTLGDRRYAVRSDPLGRKLTISLLEGTGSIRLEIPGPAGPRAAEINAMLVGDDGSAYSVSSTTPAVLPVGSYRLGTVTVGLDDPAAGPRWSFTFSDAYRKGEPTWYRVEKGSNLAVDPVGHLEFSTGLGDPIAAAPGGEINLQPKLYTGDGLLIVTVGRGAAGSSTEGPTAAITLGSNAGGRVDGARSGFA